MFQNLRQGATVYILYLSEKLRVELGEVSFVGVPMPVLSATYQPNGQYMPQRSTVDIKVNVNGQTIDLQKLPAESDIADFGTSGMVVSTSRDAILNEINAIKSASQRVIDSVDTHRQKVADCTRLVEDLNPEAKLEAERSKEIDNLKSEISGLKEMLQNFMNLQKQ